MDLNEELHRAELRRRESNSRPGMGDGLSPTELELLADIRRLLTKLVENSAAARNEFRLEMDALYNGVKKMNENVSFFCSSLFPLDVC